MLFAKFGWGRCLAEMSRIRCLAEVSRIGIVVAWAGNAMVTRIHAGSRMRVFIDDNFMRGRIVFWNKGLF